ncbi:MAG: hypothetical protein IPM24_21735 [Bryobacterales bacterium]|nr:hypothetical protein [Bryobacterales bacterium]
MRVSFLCWIALACGAGAVQAQPLDTVLVLETTPGTEQAIGLIRPRDFREDDRVAVIGFDHSARVLQPLTADREILKRTLRYAGTRITIGAGSGNLSGATWRVDLVRAIELACAAFPGEETGGRGRAIVVLAAGEDPNLARQPGTLERAIDVAGARLYPVAVYRVDERGRLIARSRSAPPVPVTWLGLVRLADASGGRAAPDRWDLQEILSSARRQPPRR